MATMKSRGESLTKAAAQLPASLWLDGGEDGRFGTHEAQAWRFDEDRIAVQVRCPAFAKPLKRRKGATLFADALVGGYLRTYLVPCRGDADMRQIVLALLAGEKAGCDSEISEHQPQGKPKGLADFYPVSVSGLSAQPQDDTPKAKKPLSLEWFDDRGCFGTDACCAFARGGGYVAQVSDTRLWRFFNNRKAEIVGRSAGGMGQLRQYALPIKIKTKAKAVAMVRAALASIAKRD
jgi:hypothetical protein